jgi:hypothetical protein
VTFGRSRGGGGEPSWALPLAGVFALVALASLLQGVAEFLVPLVAGWEPFALTRALAHAAGGVGLFAAIAFHNVGLALVAPGCGIVAARFEEDDARRRWIAPILVAATAGAVLLGVVTVLGTASPADLSFTLALAAGEGTAVLSVGLTTHRELKRFRHRHPDAQGAALALRGLAPTLVLSCLSLAALAVLEARHLVGA